IVGPSGCGKSTLLQMATGLDAPSSGAVRYRGDDVSGARSEIGYITQKANLFPWMTLAKNVELPLIVRDVTQEKRRELVARYLELAGLTGFENHYPHQLSGGMQKRASIVRTLIYSPPVVLLDEPFGSLDAQTRMQMHGDLLRLWEQQEQTVVFVTHDLQEAVTLADHIVLLSRQPTVVKAEVPIGLDRPRDVFEPYSMPGFVETYDRVWNLFRSEVISDDRG
ncbi:MAG TPA: ABC transporter ATP-binding protein, partial [Streptomyces sp.]|nr:ABC transporter ATP-binding protein [Streptomyces sp.]